MSENGKKKSFLLFSKAAAKKLLIIAAAVFFVCIEISCSKNKDDSSFLSSLDDVDAYISTGQVDDALSRLKKIEKKAYSSYARLGIYRRYMTLGESERAEKILINGLKKIPGNKEISAVYGQFLLRQTRLAEAEKVTEILAGTPYGSMYSEAVLRQAQASVEERGSLDLYLRESLCQIFYDAYIATGNDVWLRNDALIWLKKGDYKTAASLDLLRKKNLYDDCESDVFWAKVQFDCENFAQCISDLENVDSYSCSGNDSILAAAESLRSDCYEFLGDSDTAELYRKELFEKSSANQNIVVPPSVYVNSALWAEEHNQTAYRYEMLSNVCTKFPQYMPGLILYADFSYESSKPLQMTSLEQDVRKTNLRTKSMEEYDNLPKVPISDALYRIKEILNNQKKETGSSSPLLLVAYKELVYKTTQSLSVKARIADVWKTLEANETGANLYPPELVNFAIHELLNADLIEDARSLFTDYLDSRYKLSDSQNKVENQAEKKNNNDIFGGEKKESLVVVPPEVAKAVFGDYAAENVREMEIWECEVAAYFAVIDKNISAAKRLYEYVIFETGNSGSYAQDGDTISYVSQFASPSSIINLAMIYSSTGEKDKALSLYGAVAGRTQDHLLKSVVLYRTACIQYEKDDTRSAMLSLDYALSLDPSFADARLMLRKLTSQ